MSCRRLRDADKRPFLQKEVENLKEFVKMSVGGDDEDEKGDSPEDF